MSEATATTWTRAEIRERLAVSAVAFPGPGALSPADIRRVRAAGFRKMEIRFSPSRADYHDPARLAALADACREEGVAVVSIHGPDLKFDAQDEARRRHAVAETVLAARGAQQFGARVLVAHFGTGDRSRRSVCEVLEQTANIPVRITVETGDIAEVAALVRDIDCDRLGMTVDIGHARDADRLNPFTKPGGAAAALAPCGEKLFHVHLHDIALVDHLPPFHGYIRWDELFVALKAAGYAGEFLFEVQGRPAQVARSVPAAMLRDALREGPMPAVTGALGMSLFDILFGRPPKTEDPCQAKLQRLLRSAIVQLLRNTTRATTGEVLKAVAAFPDDFVARYHSP
ncbi:MAG: sugar phosphate isomerase/epimerase [Kiritimatiellae bacterium]|nr:sugar phosphate isomerase/epimerase [Kiritimatiellia bacterium]